MKRIKMMLMAMIAVLAVGAVGASQASAHAADHGSLTVVKPTILGGGTADCDFTFADDGWSGGSGEWSTNITGVAAVSPCEVSSLSGSGLVLTKFSDGTWILTGSLTFTVDTILGTVTCSYTLDNVFGTWTYQPAPPPNAEWKEFEVDPSSTAAKSSGSSLCPNPAEIVGGYIHVVV